MDPFGSTEAGHSPPNEPVDATINIQEVGSDDSAGVDAPRRHGGESDGSDDGARETAGEPGDDVEEEEEEVEENVETATSILGSIVDSAKEAVATPPEKGRKSRSSDISEADEEDAESTTLPGDSAKPSLFQPSADASNLEDIQSTLEFISSQASAPGQSGADPNFVRLRTEYDKLHKLFVQSRKNETSLVQKCKDIASELSANAAKVQAALRLSQNDRSQIIALKKEVRKAWKMVELSTEKENRAKELINSLKAEVETVRKELSEQDGGTTYSTGANAMAGIGRDKLIEIQLDQEDQISKLAEQRDTLLKQVDEITADLTRVTAENDEFQSKVERLVTERGTLTDELLTIKDLLATKKSELDRESRAREKLETSLRQANEISLQKDDDVAARLQDIKLLREQIGKLEVGCKEERAKVERVEKEKENVNARLARLQQEYDEQVLTTTRLLSENQQQTGEIKGWEEELAKYKEEYRGVTRVRDTLQKRIKALEDAKLEAELERDQLKGGNHSLSQNLEAARRNLDISHKQVDSLTRERDIAQKNFVKATGTTQKQITVVKLAEQTKRNLEQEIMGYKDEATKMRKLIYSLEKDRDRHINEAGRIRLELVGKEEEVKIGEMMLFDSRKKIGELEKKLKEQQSLYENVRADRNLYSKNLVEAQDEITEMKRKVKIMGHQIEQLKEEIASKEGALVKEHFEHSKLEKEKESLSVQIGKLQQQYEEAQQLIQNQQSEENKLRHIITQADSERLRQKKEYDTLVQERDILGTQLIRRNDELSLLYEKIKIQTSTLHKGELQYRERVEDIRVCKLEIKKLRREKAILQTETQNVEGLRADIFRLQREVLRERTRVKLLEGELSSPLNIHRWRKLSGSDPSTFELIIKIQTLQRRLIAKTGQVVEKELIINQKEKLYKEVKDVLQRQPGPEVMEELRVVREAVRSKVKECKALASELNMYHSQVNEYKYEIERVNRELQELKKKYYESRRKRGVNNGKEYAAVPGAHHPPELRRGRGVENPAKARFSGGGFNMSSTQHVAAATAHG
ncbi:uncharacterized protein EV422DRAFT_111653 [Fimicolochytrium jonesii]|uniref:uncharacterized protein n=1 Tax=Fimicolochytrium jonesii TaxID=1396493 RepID=UPI0022FEA0CC|nr:uncharacterized protein EV422DRAFT_111653 [Fimicolochytrium jonesii]KAI8819407.1 hypothetical protein EV422DRAFT_111653 [Fimicolochytrium jonesii]